MKKGRYHFLLQNQLWFLILFLAFFCTNNHLFCQKPSPRIITAEEFLKRSPEVDFALDLTIDSNGYVFFTGTSGTNRFNGRSFNVYDSKDVSLNVDFEKGFDEKIWCYSLKGKVNYLENGRVVNFTLPDSLMKTWNKKFHSIYETADKTVHLCPIGDGYLTVDSLGQVRHEFGSKSEYHGFFVEQLPDDKWIHYSVLQSGGNVQNMSLYFVDSEKKVHRVTQMNDARPHYKTSLVVHRDSSLSISAGTREIIRFKENKFIERQLFDHFIINLFIDSKNILWVGTVDHGFFKVEDYNFLQTEQYWGGAAAITAEDVYGGLWFRSDTGNFGYITPIATPHYSKQTGFEDLSNVGKICIGKDELIIQNASGKVYTLNEDSLAELKLPKVDHITGIRKVYDYPMDFCYNPKDEKLWLAFLGFILTWDGQNWEKLDLDNALFDDKRIPQITVLDNGDILGTTAQRVFKIEDKRIIPISETSLERINSFIVDNDNQIWVARQDGLYVLDKEKFMLPKKLPVRMEEGNTVSFFFEFQNEIWVQQHLKPIIRIVGDEVSYVMHKGKSIALKNYTFDPSGNLWGTSYEGESLVKIVKNNSDLEITYFACDYFLAKGKYRKSIVVTDEFVFNSTSFGLFKTSIKDLETEKRYVRIVFSEVRINTNSTELKSNYNLPYNQNNVNITFDAISFRRTPLEFSHKMVGIDSTWIIDDFENVQYTNLDPGIYTFLVRGRTKSGRWSKSNSIQFCIAKPYWKTWWFRIIALLLFLLFFYVIIRIRANKVMKKEREKSKIAVEIAQLELRALKAQINPHFIFNSITSVMHYLSQEKTNKAENYLERFSILIRKVLESSDQNMVSLIGEVELMQLYIIFESEWFEGEPIELTTSFLNFDPKSIKIPPTLLQPYIENAIRHGLKSKKGKRLIKLDFTLNADSISVRIADNGIGRKKAAKQDTRKNHKSFGMSISSRRIELLNKKKISQIFIEDLMNEKGEAIGTSIHFNTPFSQEVDIT